MKLSEPDVNLFYELMTALQYFVNQRLKILPKIKALDAYAACPLKEKFEVRKALYADIKLIDAFVDENPQQFPEEKLSIVSGWKKLVAGEFYIERYLKRYAVFIMGENVYAVLGLYEGFDEMVPRSHLPLLVRACLLPFKGKIVYDGVFETYNIDFGGGIKRDLKEIYLRAKQHQRIIESLEDPPRKSATLKAAKPSTDWVPVLDELAAAAKKLRGRAEDPAIYSPAFALLRMSIEFAQKAVTDSSDPLMLYQILKKMNGAMNKAAKVLYREEY